MVLKGRLAGAPPRVVRLNQTATNLPASSGHTVNGPSVRGSRTLHQHGLHRRYRIFAITCPFSGNSRLRRIRDTDPDAWADLVAFDREIRHGSPRAIAEGKPLRGQFFVHRSLKPLDQVDLDPPRRRYLQLVGDPAVEDDDPDGCSPWSCRSGHPVTEERAA
jgi:hypothetical protein